MDPSPRYRILRVYDIESRFGDGGIWSVLHSCGILRGPPPNTYDDTDYTEYL
jgi:hypothetical protein